MKRLVLLCSHTLYSKPLIAIASLLNKDFDEIILKNNSKFYKKYNQNKILNEIYSNPTGFKLLNKFTYESIASQINYKKEWNEVVKKIKFKKFFLFSKKDIIFCTTKDINKYYYLIYFGFQLFVIGYHHIPIVGFAQKKKLSNISNFNKLFLKHEFSKKHNFKEILEGVSFKTTNFPYLNKQKIINLELNNKNHNKYALIFHPGGSRGIISNPSDSKEKIYNVQEDMLHKLITPLIKNDFDIYIKVHPLRAKYHDSNDLNLIIKNSSLNQFATRIKIITANTSYFNYAKNAKFIFTLGSSSIYEIWLMGLENAYVINFFGN